MSQDELRGAIGIVSMLKFRAENSGVNLLTSEVSALTFIIKTLEQVLESGEEKLK